MKECPAIPKASERGGFRYCSDRRQPHALVPPVGSKTVENVPFQLTHPDDGCSLSLLPLCAAFLHLSPSFNRSPSIWTRCRYAVWHVRLVPCGLRVSPHLQKPLAFPVYPGGILTEFLHEGFDGVQKAVVDDGHVGDQVLMLEDVCSG